MGSVVTEYSIPMVSWERSLEICWSYSPGIGWRSVLPAEYIQSPTSEPMLPSTKLLVENPGAVAMLPKAKLSVVEHVGAGLSVVEHDGAGVVFIGLLWNSISPSLLSRQTHLTSILNLLW